MFKLAFTIFDNICPGGINGINETTGGLNCVQGIIANFIRLGLGLAGVLSVIFIVVGAIQYSTSAGNPAGLARAKKTLILAILGLIISIVAVGIVNFIIGKIGG